MFSPLEYRARVGCDREYPTAGRLTDKKSAESLPATVVMALFGAPLDDDDHAVQAALGMVRALDALNVEWKAAGRPSLDIGIGVNTGDMVAGNIGSSAIMRYTVIGDAVNLGARLESLNKEHGTRIIISDETRRRPSGKYDIRPLGSVIVKGQRMTVSIFEVRPT